MRPGVAQAAPGLKHFMSDNVRVAVAAVFGAGSPATNWFLNLGPVLDVLLTIGQVGVAVVTILYILRKRKNAKAKK